MTKVEINNKYSHVLPFTKLQSRLSTAIIFAYLGYKEDVMLIVLRLSHRTRAYF